MKYKHLTAIEPVSLVETAEKKLYEYAEKVTLYGDVPQSDEEILQRIGDADCVLLSYTSRLSGAVMAKCPNLRYVGMCCSLYSEESANVDIAYARTHNILVKGIRDYGDRGVVEFVLCELIRFLHGYDRPMWKTIPQEITGLRVGLVGLGVSGRMVADALQNMGAKVCYYSRSLKPEAEAAGICCRGLHELLSENEVVITCLNKNVLLLQEEEFAIMGSGKLLFNTSIGPGFDVDALRCWLENPDNYFICDTQGAIGDSTGQIYALSNVYCADASAGRTRQAFELLSQKVLDNLEESIKKKD